MSTVHALELAIGVGMAIMAWCDYLELRAIWAAGQGRGPLPSSPARSPSLKQTRPGMFETIPGRRVFSLNALVIHRKCGKANHI
jgi:hypothetical protein